jgi:thiol-disulfide isomerase/thioredoxin
MNRLTLTRTLKTALAASLVTASAWASALELKPFSAGELASLKQQGKPVAVHFHADWCSTCVSQAKSLETLRSDPDLKAMTVLIADYDKEKDLRKTMKVRSQSVFVIYKGSSEVGRINGQTRANEIKAELGKAL